MICVRCKKEAPGGTFCALCGAKQERATITRRRPNGLGSAYKRGRTWTARATGVSYTEIQKDGSVKMVRRRPTKGGFRTKSEALKWAASYDGGNEPTAPTLADLWNTYQLGALTELSKDRQTAARKAKERITPILGRRIDTLTTRYLQEVVNENASTHYTARDMKSLLSKLYQIAMADGKATTNLARFITLPELEEKEGEPFTEDEVARMWQAYDGGNGFVAYILLMVYTGMMPAELLGCKKSMVDLAACEIVGAGKKTKQRKDYSIVFPEFLRPLVEELLARKSSNGRANADKLVQMNKWTWYDEYHATLKAIGVRDLPPYSCRHTFGTEAVKGKNSPEVVRQMLRHAKITTQQRYTHLTHDEAREAVNALPKPNRGGGVAQKSGQK